MPWRETRPVDQRRELVVLALQKVRSIRALSIEYGVCRKTAHKWVAIGRREGLGAALEDRSRRPKRIRRIDAELEQRIVELRRISGEGGRNLSDKLADEGWRVSPATVDRVIARQGLGPLKAQDRAAVKRFEREAPNQMWQMDFKSACRLRSGPYLPLSLLDDHSRFAVGLTALESTAADPTWRALVTCFERYGVPETMLMDHGSPWWSTTSGHGLTRVSVELIEQGVTLYYGRVRHPQTQGKVERFHRTLDRALSYRGLPATREELQELLDSFRSEYNERRRHTALNREVPASRYVPSSRAYQSVVPRWDYPMGAEVRRLNASGVLDLPGHRFFVCEALAGKEVWCRRIEHRVLVTYRHMYVREIDLLTGRTSPIVRPANRKPSNHT
jgi:transposase InsO family protein